MASIDKNIKKIRTQKGLMQKKMAFVTDMQASNYSKIKSGQRDISVKALDKIAQLFGMKVDEIIHYEYIRKPSPIKVEDKIAIEKSN